MLSTFSPTKFKKDLKRGSVFEDFVADYFQKRGWTVKRAKGNIPAYDLILTKDRSSIYVEVKFDELSDRTQNYCLEQASLEHTQSQVLIIGTPQEAYAVSMEDARKLFNQFPHRQTGDLPWNFSALVPKQVFQLNGYQRL
jgi:hypothetical protein